MLHTIVLGQDSRQTSLSLTSRDVHPHEKEEIQGGNNAPEYLQRRFYLEIVVDFDGGRVVVGCLNGGLGRDIPEREEVPSPDLTDSVVILYPDSTKV